MEFRVLGSTEVVDRGGRPVAMGGAQRRALVTALVLRANQPCTVDWLTTAVWGDDAAGNPALLHPAVSRLRRLLEPDRAPGAEPELLTSVPGGYLLRVDADAVDALRFESILHEAGATAAAGDRERALELAECALRQWRGAAYADVADRPFAVAEAVRLNERRLDAEEFRLECLLDLGRVRDVAGQAESLVAQHPLRERLWALLMRALYRAGRQADALRAYADLRKTLIDELGIEPGPELRELELAILRQDVALAPSPAVAMPLPPAAPAVPVPGLLAHPAVPYVGRRAELEQLASAWKRAEVEGRQIALVCGEPGVGKTRIVAELASLAAEEGAHVIAGRCDDGMAVPYQPFVEALRHFTDHMPDAVLRASLGRYAGELVRLLPELGERIADLPSPLRSDAETERYRLFDAVAAWLTAASAQRPILLAIDDLHWAASPTLLLLRHLARSPEPMQVLIVATHRPTDATHPLTATTAALTRASGVHRLELVGLDIDDVRSLVADSGLDLEGADLDSVAQAMRVETGGNPLFLNELVRHVVEEGVRRMGAGSGALLGFGLPQGVRDVVTARLASLSPEANLALERAAVAGLEVDHRVLEIISALREEELDEAIGEALVAGLIAVTPGSSVRYHFAHAVVRSAVYDAIPPARRARLHRVVAEALESLEPDARDLDALAEHWSKAAAAHSAEKAVEYAIRSGRRAHAMLAYETAAARYERALEVLGERDEVRRGELLLALGEAQAASGDVKAAKATFIEAARVAEAEGDAEQLARAALGYGVAGVTASVVDERLVEMLERAAVRLPPDDSSLRVKVLARLAAELYFSREAERRRAMSQEAVAMARRVGDAEALAFALSAHHYVLWGPDGLEERLAVAREISTVAALTGNVELILQGHRWSIIDLLEMGAIEGADRHIEQYTAIANELRQPLYLWWSRVFGAMRHLLAGRLDDATAAAEEAWRIGRRSTEAAMQFFGIQSGFVLREREHLDTLETGARALVAQFPDVPAWQCALALFYADVGRHDEAQMVLSDMAAHNFADLPHDLGWLPAMANLADVAAAVGDTERAEILLDALLPYRGRNLVVGAAVACQGSVARPLGRLAALLGRWELAEELFAQAMADNERWGAPGLLAQTQRDYARALQRRGAPGDLDKADELLGDALATARVLGMVALERSISEPRA